MFFSDITTQSKAVLCDILDDSAQVTNLMYMHIKTFLTVDGTEPINELFVNYMYSLLISIQILSVQGYSRKVPQTPANIY